MTISGDFKFSFIVTNDDMIVRDHRVHNVRTVPGVAFIDIVYRYLQSKGFPLAETELRDVIFIEPIVTTEQFDRKVQITLQQMQGYWTIQATSQKIKEETVISSEWITHMQGELHLNQDFPQGTLDIDTLKQQARRVEDTGFAYAPLKQLGIDHYDFMKLQGSLHIGNGYVLAEVHLSEMGKQYAEDYYLHPAYLDGSTSIPGVFTIDSLDFAEEDIQTVIPIYLQSFRTIEQFGEKLYVYVEEKNLAAANSRDVFYTDIEFYDESGHKIARFTKFGYKRVRSEELITNLQNVDRVRKAGTSRPAAQAYVQVGEGIGIRQAIELDLQQMVAQVLDKSSAEIGVADDFYGMGLTSVDLLQFVNDLETKLGQKLYPTLLFEYTSISKLAEYLEEDFGSLYPVSRTGQTPNVQNLQQAIEIDLRQLVAKSLGTGVEAVGSEDDFYELGLDSRGLLEIVQELEVKMGQKLYPTLLFEYTNIKKLAEFFSEDYRDSYPVHQLGVAVATEVAHTAPMKARQGGQGRATEVVYYRHVWENQELEEEQAHPVATGNILVFDTNDQLSKALQEQLGKAEAQVTLVEPAETFVEAGTDVYKINPNSVDDYDELFERLEARGIVIDKIIHRWSKTDFVMSEESLDGMLNHGVYSLLHLCQALMRRQKKSRVQLLYVYHAEQEEQPLYAANFGFAKAVMMENPKWIVKTVEVRDLVNGRLPDHIPSLLLQEFLSDVEADTGIRYEGAKRFVQRLSEVDRDAELPGGVSLKTHGVYLITGGLGGLGLLFAKHLAKQYQAKLILAGRSALREEQQELLEELKAYGSEVVYAQADISKRDEVARVFAEAKSRFGALNGVIHAAGVIRDSLLKQKTMEEFEDVLASKVRGTWYLDDVSRLEELDFFVMFSSTSAVSGNIGQVDYAYANSFMDRYALYRESLLATGERFGKTLSINWPLWQEGGMSVDEQSKFMMRELTGMVPLSTELGVQAFEYGLQQTDARFMLVEGDKQKIENVLNPSLVGSGIAKSGIEILGVGECTLSEAFRDTWVNMANQKPYSIGAIEVSESQIMETIRAGGKMSHLLVKLDDTREMEVVITGRGKPMLLINGFGLTAPSWVYQLNEWSSRYQLIMIHNPGVGLSHVGRDLSLEQLSRTYADVLKKLGIDTPLHVVGASWGGMIAQRFSMDYPERVASLTLACSFANVDFFENSQRLNDLFKADFENIGQERQYDLVERNTYMNLKGTMGYFMYFDKESAFKYSTEEFLEEIQVPTLIISGKLDQVVDPKQSLYLHAKIANSQLFELPSAGHAPNVTHLEAFNKRVERFIDELEATKSK